VSDFTLHFYCRSVQWRRFWKPKGKRGSREKEHPCFSICCQQREAERKEKRKEERQQQRKVLAEQNSLLLSRMADVEGPVEVQDENTSIPDNLLEDCMEILQSRPSTNATPVSTLLHPRQRGPPSTSETTPAHSNITPPPFTQSLVTPLQPRGQEPPRILSQDQARPQFGGKCPRRRQLNLPGEDSESPGCSSCKRLKDEVQSLRAQLSAYETQTGKFLI